MKHTLEIIVNKDGKAHREKFDLPSISIEEYDKISKESPMLFNWPQKEGFTEEENFIYIWHLAMPDSAEERKILEETGRMMFIKYPS